MTIHVTNEEFDEIARLIKKRRRNCTSAEHQRWDDLYTKMLKLEHEDFINGVDEAKARLNSK